MGSGGVSLELILACCWRAALSPRNRRGRQRRPWKVLCVRQINCPIKKTVQFRYFYGDCLLEAVDGLASGRPSGSSGSAAQAAGSAGPAPAGQRAHLALARGHCRVSRESFSFKVEMFWEKCGIKIFNGGKKPGWNVICVLEKRSSRDGVKIRVSACQKETLSYGGRRKFDSYERVLLKERAE